MTSTFSAVRRLSNASLLRGVEALARQNQRLGAQLLLHIAEMDRRKLYREQGYPSMFRYLVEGLHMSEQAAYNRIQVGRAARRFPLILERMRAGELHLTGAKLLAPHLSDENYLELLARARYKTRREIEALVADLDPQPDAPELVRRLAGHPQAASLSPAIEPDSASDADASPSSEPATASSRAPAAPQGGSARRPSSASRLPDRRAKPLGRDRFKVQFTADREFVDVLEEVKSLLRHQVPDGNLSAVFGRALRVLREDLRRRKFGRTDRPARSASAPKKRARSRHVPNSIRRAVADRDAESCSYVSASGKRCGSKDFLEFEHEDPWAKNGVHRAKRIRLFCREHNLLAAEGQFGRTYMEQFSRPESGVAVRGNPGSEN